MEHNKKRNSGLLYELLVQEISRTVIDDEKQQGTKALKILKKWFEPSTQIYKEFRLANSLMKSNILSESVAGRILEESKKAIRNLDIKKLEHEKSLIIRDINHILGGGKFWENRVPEYKMWATIQLLFNDWKNLNESNIYRVGKYEDVLISWLTKPKEIAVKQEAIELSNADAKLVTGIMEKKLNEKYGKILNHTQKKLLQEWAIFCNDDTSNSIIGSLNELSSALLTRIDSYIEAEGKEDRLVVEKLEHVKKQLTEETSKVVDDNMLSRFMVYSQLLEELS